MKINYSLFLVFLFLMSSFSYSSNLIEEARELVKVGKVDEALSHLWSNYSINNDPKYLHEIGEIILNYKNTDENTDQIALRYFKQAYKEGHSLSRVRINSLIGNGSFNSTSFYDGIEINQSDVESTAKERLGENVVLDNTLVYFPVDKTSDISALDNFSKKYLRKAKVTFVFLVEKIGPNNDIGYDKLTPYVKARLSISPRASFLKKWKLDKVPYSVVKKKNKQITFNNSLEMNKYIKGGTQ